MLGLREEGFQVPGVKDEFEEGSCCARAYGQMRQAYARVCQRLGVGDEDQDLEIMIDAMENIQKELCCRAFHYGQTQFKK